MKTKFIFAFLFLSLFDVQPQEKDSLWNSFREKTDEFIIKERSRNYFEDSNFAYHLAQSIINTTVERKAVMYLSETFEQDTLPNIRDFVRRIMEEIAQHSNDSISRKKAIHYILSTSINPDLGYFYLADFDESIKQKIMQLYKRQPTKELYFLVETEVQRNMRYLYKNYDNQINDSIKKYNGTKSYAEIKEQIYQKQVSDEMNKILNAKPSNVILIISGQLHLEDAIPYLKEYANDKKNENKMMNAVCALAIMRVEDYEDRAVTYFDIDTYDSDTRLASIINSQKIWYAYIRRLKSEGYSDKCPDAYFAIRALSNVLKDFPRTDRPWFEGYVEFEDGIRIPIPSKITPKLIVPDDCGMSTQIEKTPINPDHIKYVVDWMEANKGKYELKQKVEKAF
jgi:hypothetical protein